VATEADDPRSILHLYRRLLSSRKASVALREGAQDLLTTPDGVLGWERRSNHDHRIVLVNFTAAVVEVDLADWHDATVEVASDGQGEGEPFHGRLGAEQALLLRPRPASAG
jgi:alpha-glucosidase